MAGSVGMIIVNVVVIGITVVVMYNLIAYAERKTRVNVDIARDFGGK